MDRFFVSLFVLFFFTFPSSAVSQGISDCSKIARLPDANCDAELVIAVLGDSLVSGVGDTQNPNGGGYVLRTSRQIRPASFLNFGVSGETTAQLLSRVQAAFKKNARGKSLELQAGLYKADLVVLDIGRNDRWLFGTPAQTAENLNKIRKVIERRVTSFSGVRPIVVISVLMLPNRGSQGPWVAELNQILIKQSTNRNPSDLRFDKVSKRLLSADNVHPTSIGYAEISKVFLEYIRRRYPALVKARNRLMLRQL